MLGWRVRRWILKPLRGWGKAEKRQHRPWPTKPWKEKTKRSGGRARKPKKPKKPSEGKKGEEEMKKRLWRWVGLGLTMVGCAGTSWAVDFTLGDRPASVMGGITQNATYGFGPTDFDDKNRFNSAVLSAVVEGDYRPAQDLKFYVAGKFTADWAYPLLNKNSEWSDQEFNESRGELYLDTGWNNMLHEATVTWSPGSLFIRAGKQIVGWGETDGFRLMDQINPVDGRRGLGDVEYENTIMPIWLLRANYYVQPQTSWLQDLGLETVFNPNAHFQPDRPIELGNDVAGIWAPYVEAGGGAQLGAPIYTKDEPDTWDPKGMEFGARVKGVINDMIFSLNYFNGLSNEMQLRLIGAPSVTVTPGGQPVVHLPLEVRYPRYQIAGATFSSDVPFLSASALGGVAPVLRAEAFYMFNHTMSVEGGVVGPPLARYVTRDEVRYMVGLDWKVKVDFLNPKAYFFLSGQFYHRKVLGFADDMARQEINTNMDLKDYLGNVEKDNYLTSLMINTTYFHNKLAPQIFWMRDYTLNGNMFKVQLTYDQSDKWHYTVGALFLDGKDSQKGFEPLKNKDQLFATVRYRF